MSILQRLFGSSEKTKPPETEEKERELKAAEATLRMLQDKLAQDPCAADPTREECAPEVKRAIKRRPDPASALLSSRDAWRSAP